MLRASSSSLQDVRAWSQLTKEQRDIARRLQVTAETERRVKAPQLAGRTTSYGELLVLCTRCHATR